jgi:LmbE family N-acetylglucosaminyl deacetylase
MTRILAIAAHPDDAELGCGGLLQRADNRRILMLTHGENGGDYHQRTGEELESAVVLEASAVWASGTTDGYLVTKVAAHAIESEIRKYQPDMVLTMAAADTHQDHRAVHEATLIACRDYHGTVLAYVGPSSAATFRPTWFVPMSESQLAVKVRAVACHTSQRKHAYTSQEAVEGMARYWAMVTRSKALYVEPYEVVRAWMV